MSGEPVGGYQAYPGVDVVERARIGPFQQVVPEIDDGPQRFGVIENQQFIWDFSRLGQIYFTEPVL